jgi:hypothetical protein
MKYWFTSINGAVILSVLTLLTHVWRGYLDAMFVIPVDIGDEATMHMYALIFTALLGGWAYSILLTRDGKRGGLIMAFVINALVLIAIPISWLFFYCPAECQSEAGLIFNLANTLNLIFGILAFISLGWQLRESRQKTEPLEVKKLST